jgi:alkyl hydroperoxide reductase subunit AhpF
VPFLDEATVQKLKDEFGARLTGPVKLVVFSQALADPESEQARRLVEEVVALDPRLTVENANFVLDKDRAEALRVGRIPAIAFLGEGDKDHGIRMYGMPDGYEFGLLVETILDVSAGQSGLAPETKEALAALSEPVHLQVFSTPT